MVKRSVKRSVRGEPETFKKAAKHYGGRMEAMATEFRRQPERLTITQQNLTAAGGNDTGSPA
jgi:hypothetical protein